MENSVSTEKKQSILKTLAVAGLLGVTILFAWLAIQIVQLFPTALTSLVSVAHSVYNYNPLETKSIELTEQATLVNAGEAFTITWSTPLKNGTYTFRYECESGVTISLSNDTVNFSDLRCDTEYDIGTTNTVTLFINTSVERFTTVTYSLSLYRQNSSTAVATQPVTVTVVNSAITEVTRPATESDTEVPVNATSTPVTKPEESVANDTAVAETKPAPAPTPESTTPSTSTPTYTYTYTYEIPNSNPNGTADLSPSIVGIGTLRNSTFVSTNRVDLGVSGALQFSVRNLGDKTSDSWTYEIALPDGSVYASGVERPLLPNERALFTLSYPAPVKSGSVTIAVTIRTSNTERTTTNNTAGQTIIINN